MEKLFQEGLKRQKSSSSLQLETFLEESLAPRRQGRAGMPLETPTAGKVLRRRIDF